MKIYSLLILSVFLFGCSSQTTVNVSTQKYSEQRTLLPTGHYLSPAGTSLLIGDFPLGTALSPDKRTLIVVNSGYFDQTLSVVNIPTQKIKQTMLIRKSWMGAVWSRLGDYFFVTGGNDNKVYRYGFEKDSAWFLNSIALGKEAPAEFISPTGISINSETDKIYAVSRITPILYELDTYENKINKKLRFDNPLYSCVLDEERKLIYISEWGASRVTVVQMESFQKVLEIPVGKHPSAMVMNKNRSHLFVTNSAENTVSVINLQSFKVEETIDVALIPNSPIGSTPNALALGNGDSILYVALADNNALAVVDIKTIGQSIVKGFIPTGWYPTSVQCADSLLIVTNGKGNSSGIKQSPNNPFDYLKGTISFIQVPNDDELKKLTKEVLINNPYTREKIYSDWNDDNPVPKFESDSSPIKHIFYIVKELRSYDEIFGDMKMGKGDSTFAKYGKRVAPNHHSLASEFTLFDNFYTTASTSANGMHWSTAAYSTDYIEKTIPTLYGRRGGLYDYEKDGISTSPNGFIWDAARKSNLRIRNYGIFLEEDASARGEIIPIASGLFNSTSPTYRGWDLNYYDTARVSAWEREFDRYVQGDSLPHLSIIRLPNDHTAGKKIEMRTQEAFVADNDLALGKIVEKISKSRYWKESAIFVLETSASGGVDHVDAQRSVALVVSPYTKRKFVDHTHYTTTSVLRTMELILNIPPMTQHDAGAMPMYRAFQSIPDVTPYIAKPNNIPLNEKYINPPSLNAE